MEEENVVRDCYAHRVLLTSITHGKVELYYGNEIRDALTGDVIVEGSHDSNFYPTANNWQRELNGLPVAVDILPSSPECPTCNGLELVLGHVIYAVDVAGGKLTEALVMDDATNKVGYTGNYFPKEPRFSGQNFSTTAVVDYNGDGALDVLTSGATGNRRGPTTVFFWDLNNDPRQSVCSIYSCRSDTS